VPRLLERRLNLCGPAAFSKSRLPMKRQIRKSQFTRFNPCGRERRSRQQRWSTSSRCWVSRIGGTLSKSSTKQEGRKQMTVSKRKRLLDHFNVRRLNFNGAPHRTISNQRAKWSRITGLPGRRARWDLQAEGKFLVQRVAMESFPGRSKGEHSDSLPPIEVL